MNFEWLSHFNVTAYLLGIVILFVVIAAWCWMELKLQPERGTLGNPDVTAHSRGKCGDAMEISLQFRDDKVVAAKYWTDGCRMSNDCGAAAVRLALGKTPEELADLDHRNIEAEVGYLPEEDRHCATLAAGTLHEALRIYMTAAPESTGSTNPLGKIK